MSREGALWVGGLESYMDEPFIQRALQLMGEAPPLSIKVGEEAWFNPGFSHVSISGHEEQVQ